MIKPFMGNTAIDGAFLSRATEGNMAETLSSPLANLSAFFSRSFEQRRGTRHEDPAANRYTILWHVLDSKEPLRHLFLSDLMGRRDRPPISPILPPSKRCSTVPMVFGTMRTRWSTGVVEINVGNVVCYPMYNSGLRCIGMCCGWFIHPAFRPRRFNTSINTGIAG